MKKEKCFECGSTNAIEYHHVVPRSLGGKKTVPLCMYCHSLVHGLKRKDALSLLIKKGLRDAKLRGKVLGRPKGRKEELSDFLKRNYHLVNVVEMGYSVRLSAKIAGVSPNTIQKVKRALAIHDNGNHA